MNDTAGTVSTSIDNSEGMSYLSTLPKRLVSVYMPLFVIVFVLLFPFYWMGITAVKPKKSVARS